MLQPTQERPLFFKVKHKTHKHGTASWLHEPHITFQSWFKALPDNFEMRLSSGYTFCKKKQKRNDKQSILTVQCDPSRFTISSADGIDFVLLESFKFHLINKDNSFIVWNAKATDAQFSDLGKKRAVLDTFIDFLESNLFLIDAVLHHSFDNVQKALIEGAIPDMPFVNEGCTSLLHYCYKEPQAYDSSIRKIGRELIYWGADTKALLAALPSGFITPKATQQAKDDINQIEKVKNIVNKMIAEQMTWEEYFFEFSYTPLVELMKIYNESGPLVSHKDLMGKMYKGYDVAIWFPNPYTKESVLKWSYEHQLLIIQQALDPKYAKNTVNETGTFCGLGNFILDPVKRNPIMEICYKRMNNIWFDGKTLLMSSNPSTNQVKGIIPVETTWRNEKLTADAWVVNIKRLEKAVYRNDAKKVAGILLWLGEYRQIAPNKLKIIDDIFERLWIEAAKNGQYEIIIHLVNAHSTKSMVQVAGELSLVPDTKRTGNCLLYSPHSAALLGKVCKSVPTDISRQIFSFFAAVSKKEFEEAAIDKDDHQRSNRSNNW